MLEIGGYCVFVFYAIEMGSIRLMLAYVLGKRTCIKGVPACTSCRVPDGFCPVDAELAVLS